MSELLVEERDCLRRTAMDPVSLIVAALAAGAVAGAQSTATDAIKDAYLGLKELVRRRLAGRPAGEVAVEQHAVKPDRWEKALEGELVDSGAATDERLVAAAQHLMTLLDTAGTRAGKYQVVVRDSQGVLVGDHNIQNNTFGGRPRTPEGDPPEVPGRCRPLPIAYRRMLLC